MPQVKRQQERISAFVPAAIVQRLERIAPVAEGQRSAFIRKAVEAALDQAEEREPAPGSAA